ncbi:hypothetical protein EV426DRAFT_570835 [Tirmania nivea]|nr:hypothetical protein EV426DRAFT_570835 [Tirmania nivea]
MWKRRSPPTSNHIYRRLFDNACTRELECFLAQVNSHCTINSLRRILRPSDHELLGGIVLPSYIQLGNEAIHQLTVGNARDTVSYYLADPSRGGGQGMAPEPTMGRDLEALLCLLLDLKSLDQIEFTLERMDFIDIVSRTMNHNSCSPWNPSNRLSSKRKRKGPISPTPERKNSSYEEINTIIPKVVDALNNGTTVEHSQTSAIQFLSLPRAAIKWDSSNKPICASSGQCMERQAQAPPPGQHPGPPTFSQPLPNLPTKSIFQSYCPLEPVPELRLQDSSQHTGHTSLGQQLLASCKNHELEDTRQMAPSLCKPRPEPHVTDLLLHTFELSIKQSKIDAQKKQLDECKNVLTQLIYLSEELSNNPLTIPKDVVQDFLQDIVSGLVRDGVFLEKVSDKDSKDLQKPPAPSIPGPIRRGPMTRSQAVTTSRTTPVRIINGPSEGGTGAGLAGVSAHELAPFVDADRRLHQLAAPVPGPSSIHKQPRNKPQKTRAEPYPRRKPSNSHPAAREILISSLRARIKAAQKKIDKGQGDIVRQQNLKVIMQQQIQQLQKIELRNLGPGTVENAAHERLKKELGKKIRKKTQQVEQGRAVNVNAPMLNGFKELLRRLTAVQAVGADKRDGQEMDAGEENLPSRSAWKGKEIEDSPSEVHNWFGNQHLAGSGALRVGQGGNNAVERFVDVVGDSCEEYARTRTQTGDGFFGGGFEGSGISRDQAHIPVIVLGSDGMDRKAQQAGMDDYNAAIGNFGDGNGTRADSRDADFDQEMAEVPASWEYNPMPDKAPLIYRFGALGAPAGMNNAGGHIPAGTSSPLGIDTIRGIDAPMKYKFSGSLFARSGLGPAFGSSGFGANSAAFPLSGAGKGKGASLFGGKTAFGTGVGRGTGDSPILIEDSD